MTTKQCCELSQLKKLLKEQLGPIEETEVVEHVGSCTNCQSRLLELSAERRAIDNLKQFLRVSPSTELQSSPRHPSLESIQKLLAPTDDPKMIGRLGNLEICGMVGQGSNGIVFKAFDARLNRIVAIKLLSPSFRYDEMARLRFEREVRAIATVAHENVVPIHSVDEFEGLPYFVMPYFPAGSLQKRINQKGPLSTCEVVRFGLQIARGLAEAHKQGIVHRDIKPANVLLKPGVDRAYVSDFGLVQISGDTLLTRTGILAGTPEYMSPEQVNGQPLDFRSDLFSLGSVMYAACTGRSPFHSDTVFGVMKKVCASHPRSIRDSNGDIPIWLDAFIAKLHAPCLDDRFESADEVAKLLETELAFLNTPTTVCKPSREWQQNSKQREGFKTLRVISLICATCFLATSVWQLAPNFFSAERTTNQQVKEDNAKSLLPPDQLVRHKIESQKEVERLLDEGDAQLSKMSLFRAAECFRSALALDASNVTAQERLESTNQKLELCLASYSKACAHAIQNQTDDAFRWLEKAIADGFRDINYLQTDRDLDKLRDDKRFGLLIRKVEVSADREKRP